MAFRRLHDEVRRSENCIQDIRLTDPRDDETRIEDTKGGLLQESYRWILDHRSFEQWQHDPLSRLWIEGDSGEGKTMLLCGLVNELEKTSRGATVSYFCQAADSHINSATAVLRGLLLLLLSQHPSLIHHARAKYDQAESKGLFEDPNAWDLPTTYLIIDALDECTTDLPKLLEFIMKQSTKHTCMRWLVSSRNLPHIEEKLYFADSKMRLSLEVNAFSVANAVAMYIQWKMSLLAKQKGTSKWNVLNKIGSFPPGLTPLYRRMLRQISESDDDELCKLVLATVTLAYRPLALEEVVALNKQLQDIGDDTDLVQQLISRCGSLLTIQSGLFYFVHQSAKDFILAEGVQEVFPSGKDHVHRIFLTRSIETMSKDLLRDIYSLADLGCGIEEVTKPDTDPLVASRYSCVYWVDHLCNSNLETLDKDSVDAFLRNKYVFWLEALSLEVSMIKGVISMAKLHSLFQVCLDRATLEQRLLTKLLIICYHEGTVKIWNLSSHMCTKTLRVRDGNPYRVALSQESNQLACVFLAQMSPIRLEKKASVVTTWDMRRDVRLQTHSTQGDLWNLFYDTMGTHLQTEYGPIGATPEPLLMDISHDGNWITYSGKNVLRIPVEHRAHRYLFPTTTCKPICGTKLAILTQAGHVWLCVYTGRRKE
ncbi:hypothetical protein HBI56_047910 [Parastagonospora nodorum]|nr:hypothetical protein HBI95_110250 [Parastagonospora nodorum]KAH4348803.1 hypothetical protein HBH98_072540 [Parastagonospora nodorum]KAH4391726.1 hypothetical protein HBH97_040190 [Parastagonospora nodorum]KAH4392412.1 hypothetical protein HBH99_143400 [Parastagonospora nodorum]KAH5133496.1 hypothetical protein HBH70_154210 [Parastagonospora nodorum]